MKKQHRTAAKDTVGKHRLRPLNKVSDATTSLADCPLHKLTKHFNFVENKDLRAWKTDHLQELDRLRLLVEYLESENQDSGQQKQQQRKSKKRKGEREPCSDPASTTSETVVGNLEMDSLASLKATLLKHADALRRNRYFIEATRRDSPQGHSSKSPSISLWNTSVASSLKQIIGELSRWQHAPPKDSYGEQLFLCKRYLDLVRGIFSRNVHKTLLSPLKLLRLTILDFDV